MNQTAKVEEFHCKVFHCTIKGAISTTICQKRADEVIGYTHGQPIFKNPRCRECLGEHKVTKLSVVPKKRRSYQIKLERKAIEYGFDDPKTMLGCLQKCTTRRNIAKMLTISTSQLARVYREYGFSVCIGPRIKPYRYSTLERNSGNGSITKVNARTFLVNDLIVSFSVQEVPKPQYNGSY